MISFHVPFLSGEELSFIEEAIQSGILSGDGPFNQKCCQYLENYLNTKRVLLTPSCTDALEMCAMLCDISPGDEIIMPSFNFVSAANAFILRGGSIKFVDIRPDNLNIDENQIEQAITSRTKAILVMHYGGVACSMTKIMALAKKYGLFVIEDAAHCLGATYNGRHLGTIGDLGALSFHSTKNIQCGEGGALLINNQSLIKRAEIIQEKGTDKKAFLAGKTTFYSWQEPGSSFLISEICAAFLFAQLKYIDEVKAIRRGIWFVYHSLLKDLTEQGYLAFNPKNPHFDHNGHIFYLLLNDQINRSQFIEYMAKKAIKTPFHYIPLHQSPANKNHRWGKFIGQDKFTTSLSRRLVRLPLHTSLQKKQTEQIAQSIFSFFHESGI